MNKFKLMLLASLVVTPGITFAGGYGMADEDFASNATTNQTLSAEEILNMSSEAENPTPFVESAVPPVQYSSSRRGGRTNYYQYAATRPETAQSTRRRGGLGYSSAYQRTVPTYRNYSNSAAYQKYLEEMRVTLEGTEVDARYYRQGK